MGYMKHHSISVSSFIKELTQETHNKAVEIFGDLVSPIIKSKINGYTSFFIAPDGSKEDWPESYEHDIKRDMLIKFIENKKYEDGSNSIRYCEFTWGEDDYKSSVCRNN